MNNTELFMRGRVAIHRNEESILLIYERCADCAVYTVEDELSFYWLHLSLSLSLDNHHILQPSKSHVLSLKNRFNARMDTQFKYEVS
jgi:hypothetical protein